MQSTNAHGHEGTKGSRVIGSLRTFVPSCLCAYVFCSFVLADSIFVGTLERPGAVIKELKGDSLVFEMSGRVTETQASKVTKLVVTNEPPLNAAEDAYAAGRWDQAVDGYQKVIRTTSKPWIKDWSAMRLIDAANKSGRFDAAASAYILTLLKDPAAAVNIKPTMPESRSTFLDSAVTDVNAALNDTKLTTDQRRALLGFLIELQQARKDQPAEEAAYEQLAKLPGADANDPTTRRVLGNRKLSAAQRFLAAKSYPQAIKEIDSNRSLFVEPAQQAEALYLLAEARYGLAGNDPVALKDAGLAYMRVVAAAKDEPGRPNVVNSLLKTAGIMEQLGEPKAAIQLNEQVLSQFSDDPSSIRARENLIRLKQQASN